MGSAFDLGDLVIGGFRISGLGCRGDLTLLEENLPLSSPR